MENAVMSYRLDQYLTLAGEGSRSQVKQFLKKGLVQVDGITEKQAKRKVLGNEQITLNGKPVYYEEHCYLMLHKPAGVVTATEDKKEKDRHGSNYFAAEKGSVPGRKAGQRHGRTASCHKRRRAGTPSAFPEKTCG